MKALGWFFVPYIMLVAKWRELESKHRIWGVIWTAFMVFDEIRILPQYPVVFGLVLVILAIVITAKRINFFRNKEERMQQIKTGRTKVIRVNYLTGHPHLKSGNIKISQSSSPNTLTIKGDEIKVVGCQWMPKENTLIRQTKRAKSGLGGAVVGGVLLGPAGMVAGAIIGRRPAEVSEFNKDESISVLLAEINGLQIPMYFQCNARQHQRLVSLL